MLLRCLICRTFKFIIFTIFLSLLLPVSFCYANFSWGNKKVLIKSDELTVDNKSNVALFRKNVVVQFEDLVLKTDQIQVYFVADAKSKSITRIVIPSKIKAIRRQFNQTIVASAAEYLVDSGKLIFSGQVIIEKDNVIFTAAEVVFLTKLKTQDQ